jgi:sugar lactone lactonase YvrE
MSAAWTGGFLQLKGVAFDGAHGPNPQVGGNVHVMTSPGPGWARPGTTDFKDPRAKPFGPLPKDWMHYKGLYRSGDRVIFSYSVGAMDVLESPGIEGIGDASLFTRTFRLGPATQSHTLLVGDLPGAGEGIAFNDLLNSQQKQPAQAFFKLAATGTKKDGVLACAMPDPAIVTAPKEQADAFYKAVKDAQWQTVVIDDRTRLYLTLPAHADPLSFILCVAGKRAKDLDLDQALHGVKLVDLPSLVKGGPAQWTQTFTTKGKLADAANGDAASAAYVVDTLTVPEKNPYNSWMRFGGFDFFPDGKSAAVCTWSGDVWVVSGIDEKLEKLTWKRYAAGLFQPLGLKIVDGKIYVHGRDQITRLHDLNNDGEADFYENFNNDVKVTPGFHEFAFDLHTDPDGNFYFIKAGPVNPGGGGFGVTTEHNGSLMRVSKDGSKLDVIATGFRAPNGIGVGPRGEITTGDNQGTWTPVCRLNWVKPGGFYGVVDLAHRDKPPTQTDNPLCWLPYSWDNSSGSQVWVPDGSKWGPFGGDLLHLSYGKCKLFKVLVDRSNAGEIQGGVVRFPLKFDTGVMRGRFNPADGQLYVAGLRGWQTEAAQDAALHRVRYTGKPVNMPTGLRVRPDGIEITFTGPLKEELANDAGSFSVEQWNYRWTGEYGSDEYSARDPKKKGHDTLDVKAAKLMPDGKTVFLALGDLKPVMQMVIKYDLESADGAPVADEVALTINAVGDKKLVVSTKAQ